MTPDNLIHSPESVIAVREYGGAGSPIVLLHGAGESLASMAPLAQRLACEHHVVSIDMRGHGRSSDAGWTFEGVLADVEAVVAELGLSAPAVVGHSLGGMVAAAWGARRADAPVVVNLDGNPLPSDVAQLPGLDPEFAAAQLAAFQQGLAGVFSQLAAPIDDDVLVAMEAQYAAAARAAGIDEALWLEALQRKLSDADGQRRLRPSAVTLGELASAQAALSLDDVYRQTRSPLLVVSGTRGLPMHAEFPEMWDAFRRGTRDRLDALAAQTPLMRHEVLEGSAHTMHVDDIDRVVALIEGALAP